MRRVKALGYEWNVIEEGDPLPTEEQRKDFIRETNKKIGGFKRRHDV